MMRIRLAFALGMLAAALLFSTAIRAQNNNQPPPQSPAVKPQGAAATPDLTGVWNAMRGNYDFSSFSKGDPPMTPWGKAQFDAAKPSQGPRGVKLSETNDMVYKCVPPGMPYIYLQLFPMQIVQTLKK